jgi:hypothetical protein|nr:MAG TPA_asm: protein of unknown function (DUF1937) [Caudoviricetes sp.]
MTKKKLFVSFPAINREEHYMKKIVASVKELRIAKDYIVLSPLNTIAKYGDEEYEEAVAHDLAVMLKCDALYFTKGCDRSKLCFILKEMAKFCNIPILKQIK